MAPAPPAIPAEREQARLLDQLLPAPRLLEIEHVEIAAPPELVWERIRHGNLAPSPLIRALFAVRGLPSRLRGKRVETAIHLDDLQSFPERPGFQILAEAAPHEVAVGAIGKVWQPDIPFAHVPAGSAFADFKEPGFIKVAWSIRVLRWGIGDSRIELEVRVDATDEHAWREFRKYFRVIGPASLFIRRALLSSIARELGSPESAENERALPGDDRLPDARAQITHGITIAAPPETIWPWLLQLGGQRAGFYSIDLLDNAGARSAREIDPELLDLAVGQVIPATPDGADGFEVLDLQPERVLLLGGLYDGDRRAQLAFASRRPRRFWHVTWAFVLEPLDPSTTRLHVRVRAAFSAKGRLRASWIRPVHHFMQSAMLRHLAARAEGRLPRDDYRDVLDGIAGGALVLASLFTPFLRGARSHWGLDEAAANRQYTGDELVPDPGWGWTHGVEIETAAADVWPWIAQLGADRAGFYSYSWLENVAGCKLRNAEVLHPEWELREGDWVLLHPKAPRIQVARLERGRLFVLHAPPDSAAQARGEPWASMSWLFLLEPLGDSRCRLISRYRTACSPDLTTRRSYGAALVEPIGFAMDRRMLLGVKQRAERRTRRFRPAAAH